MTEAESGAEPGTAPADAAPARVRLRITGRVQGVYFRANAAAEARALGLAGWVRNLPDGRVEAEAEGPRGALTRFVVWCHHGPPAAQVDGVETRWAEPTGAYEAFAVRQSP
jgi:acylphosphatase